MNGFAQMVLSVEEGDMKSKLQDILRIVKQRGESGRRETIAFFTPQPQLPARLVPRNGRGREVTRGVCGTQDL